MRKIASFALAAMLLFSGQTYADPNNIIRINAPIGKGAPTVKWIPADSLYSTWTDTADVPTCTTWAPDPGEIANGTAFLQSSSDCQQSQERTVQAREKNAITGVYRNVGNPLLEQQFITTSLTRSAVGTYVNPGVWLAASPVVSSWTNVGAPTACSNWTPDPSTIANGLAFQQTATDCQQSQERTSQAREKNDITGVYRDVGSPNLEQQFTLASLTRSAVGTYVNPGVWLTASPVVSSWTNVGVPTACSNWTPDPSTISNGLSFQQTATDCQQTQERTVQAREQNTISLVYRNVGDPQTQNQTLTVSSVRMATGTNPAKTAVWMLKPGISGTYVGFNSQASFGSILTAEPGYGLKFSYFGSGGWIWVSVTGYNNQRNIPSIKVELLDASNNVTRTLSDTSFQLQSYVMGIKYTADDLAAAKVADKMRLTLQLLP